VSWGCVVTRARAGGTGEQEFGHYVRAWVCQLMASREWVAWRSESTDCEQFDTWAEAMSYALGKDETDDRETE